MRRTPLERKAPLRRADGKDRAAVPVMRPKACRHCRERFLPARPLQSACSAPCAIALATAVREKSDRAADRAKREKLKTRSDWVREAQTAFNAFIRARDHGRPCICCGGFGNGWSRGGEFDAGHYRSRGAAPHLRFDERNVHAQLKRCNRYASGNVFGYRKGLIERIGQQQVAALECDETPGRWSIEELKAIRDQYRRRAREIARARFRMKST